MTEPSHVPAEDDDPAGTGLLACLVELERHVGELGPDQPPRLFALVRNDDLLAAEPGLAQQLGIRSSADGGPVEALTAVEQDTFTPGTDLIGALSGIEWPDSVHGCAVACERSFLPAGLEHDLPDDPEQAAAAVHEHPQRQDVRVVVGVLRSGHRHGVARLVQHPEELLGGVDLVPGLAQVLAYTLLTDDPGGPEPERPGQHPSEQASRAPHPPAPAQEDLRA
ncbi:hypothetical protein SAMN04489747_2683 [Auraticoccus monumenti]|uniref:Uncharacterized protein n=1 Tax=Auraticoccus monumenti TaxID=675864 RepID=A0A1G7ANX8_9ACTN|nr:PPA1309 family protein [Auraticoccus monumenti]SDE16492.1 hypothetical protein SAMN04489747_2683 [Auraticoccus monumenti]